MDTFNGLEFAELLKTDLGFATGHHLAHRLRRDHAGLVLEGIRKAQLGNQNVGDVLAAGAVGIGNAFGVEHGLLQGFYGRDIRGGGSGLYSQRNFGARQQYRT